YSSGMYVRLAFAVAAHLDPEVLIIDEVLAVGDLAFQRRCLGAMQDAANQGRTVIFVSHQLDAVHSLTRRCLWLESGRLRGDGPTSEILGEYQASIQRNQGQTLSEWRSRRGTGQVRLTDFSAARLDGKPLALLEHSPLALTVTLEATEN